MTDASRLIASIQLLVRSPQDYWVMKYETVTEGPTDDTGAQVAQSRAVPGSSVLFRLALLCDTAVLEPLILSAACALPVSQALVSPASAMSTVSSTSAATAVTSFVSASLANAHVYIAEIINCMTQTTRRGKLRMTQFLCIYLGKYVTSHMRKMGGDICVCLLHEEVDSQRAVSTAATGKSDQRSYADLNASNSKSTAAANSVTCSYGETEGKRFLISSLLTLLTAVMCTGSIPLVSSIFEMLTGNRKGSQLPTQNDREVGGRTGLTLSPGVLATLLNIAVARGDLFLIKVVIECEGQWQLLLGGMGSHTAQSNVSKGNSAVDHVWGLVPLRASAAISSGLLMHSALPRGARELASSKQQFAIGKRENINGLYWFEPLARFSPLALSVLLGDIAIVQLMLTQCRYDCWSLSERSSMSVGSPVFTNTRTYTPARQRSLSERTLNTQTAFRGSRGSRNGNLHLDSGREGYSGVGKAISGLSPLVCAVLVSSPESLSLIREHLGDLLFIKHVATRDGVGLSPLAALAQMLLYHRHFDAVRIGGPGNQEIQETGNNNEFKMETNADMKETRNTLKSSSQQASPFRVSAVRSWHATRTSPVALCRDQSKVSQILSTILCCEKDLAVQGKITAVFTLEGLNIHYTRRDRVERVESKSNRTFDCDAFVVNARLGWEWHYINMWTGTVNLLSSTLFCHVDSCGESALFYSVLSCGQLRCIQSLYVLSQY